MVLHQTHSLLLLHSAHSRRTAAAPCPLPAGAPDAVVCCPICSGRGVRVAQPCSCCRGRGLARQPRQVPVRVPRGVDSGSTLRIPAEGDLSRLGGPRGAVLLELQVSGGWLLCSAAAASWLVTFPCLTACIGLRLPPALQVSPEEGIWRRGLDLHSQLAVPLWDALLGGTATVSTLRGDARLTIPPGTQHGAVLSLAQAGVQREGDGRGSCGAHHFEVVVELPRQVSSAEQELLQRLAELQRRRRRRGSGSRSAGGGG